MTVRDSIGVWSITASTVAVRIVNCQIKDFDNEMRKRYIVIVVNPSIFSISLSLLSIITIVFELEYEILKAIFSMTPLQYYVILKKEILSCA